jgi:SHS2 domain-containing protein
MPTEPSGQPDRTAGFEVVEHTADWSLRVWGKDLRELLSTAATGMSWLMVSDLSEIAVDIERHVELDAFDAETLVVDWLGELVFWAEDELLVFRDFDLTISSDFQLKAVVRGGIASELVKHIKAVTYHGLVVERMENGLQATIVFDV